MLERPRERQRERDACPPTHRSGLCWPGHYVELVYLYHPRLTLDVPHWDLKLQLTDVTWNKSNTQ